MYTCICIISIADIVDQRSDIAFFMVLSSSNFAVKLSMFKGYLSIKYKKKTCSN